ncbi:3-hydroxylacyl-ACP dehydratase [Streptomyces sp. NPDC021622]|uniref:3-hydroxylacyl-ACP dehydratase n=1 Tax=Streptomyces sp. NPDC021622 TaxID=3155013 RepID=UPI0033C51003
MRFHLIDRISDWEPDVRLTGRKVTSPDETYWKQTPAGPVMPGNLVLEALAQAGTWLFLLSSGYRKRAALATVTEATWHGDAVPGDALDLEVRIRSTSDTAAVLDGTVRVEGRTVLEVEGLMCALIDADRLEDPADTERMGRQLLGQEALR